MGADHMQGEVPHRHDRRNNAMNENRGFTFQFAIRTPSGRLYSEPCQKKNTSDYNAASYMSILGIGMHYLLEEEPEPRTEPTHQILVFDCPEDAATKLQQLQKQAAAVGVDNYGGAVVARLCSPFTDLPSTTQFAAHVEAWMENQQ